MKPFFMGICMSEVSVIGPIKGFYYLGYHRGSKFYSIKEFVSKELAQAIALKMRSCGGA